MPSSVFITTVATTSKLTTMKPVVTTFKPTTIKPTPVTKKAITLQGTTETETDIQYTIRYTLKIKTYLT